MSGRHQRAGRRPSARRRYVLVGVLVLAVVATAAWVVVIARPDDRSPTAATSRSSACTAGVALTVAADPTVAAVIGDIADAWSARRPVVGGVCPTVTVRSQSSADAASAFAKP